MLDPFAPPALASARRNRATVDPWANARQDSQRVSQTSARARKSPAEIEAEAYEEERKRLESEAEDRQRQEQVAAKAALKAQNDAAEAAFRKEGRPFFTNASGQILPTQDDATYLAEKQRKAANDAKASEYFQLSRPFRYDAQGNVVPRHTDEEWEAQKQAKGAALEAAKIDKANKEFREKAKSGIDQQQAVLGSNDDLIQRATQKLQLQADNAKAEVAKRKRFIDDAQQRLKEMDLDDPQYAKIEQTAAVMQAELDDLQAKADAADEEYRRQQAAKLAFDTQQDVLKGRLRQEEAGIDELTAPPSRQPATGIAPVGSAPTPRAPATDTAGVREQALAGRMQAIAQDPTLDDAQRKSALTQLGLRRKDPAAYQTAVRLEMEDADAETLAPRLEQKMQEHEQRMTDLEARTQAYTQKRDQAMNSVQVAWTRAQQRMSGPHTAGDLVTVPSPDGQQQVSMPRDVAEGYLMSLARAKQWQDANQAEGDLLEIEGQEANLDAELLNEGVKVLNAKQTAAINQQAQQARAEKSAAMADLRAAGFETQAGQLQSLDQEADARVADIEDMYPEDSPERQAALEAIQKDIAQKKQGVQKGMQAQEQAAAKLYQDWGKGFAGNWITGQTPEVDDPDRPGAVITPEVTDRLKDHAKKLGMSEKDLRYQLEMQRLMDWSTPATSAANRQQSGVTEGLRVKLAEAFPQTAKALGTDDLPAEPTRTLPSGDIMPNPELGASREKFDTAIEAAIGTDEAKARAKALWPQYREAWLDTARATLETQTTLPGVQSYQQWRESRLAKGEFADMTENQIAERYIGEMEKRHPLRKFMDVVTSNLMAGSHDILTAIYGTAGVLFGAADKARGDTTMRASKTLSEMAAAKAAESQRLTEAQSIEGAGGLGYGIAGQAARMAPGAVATMATGNMTGAMIAGAMQTGGMTYADAYQSRIKEGSTHEEAWAQAAPASVAAGAMTAALTRAFPGGVTALNNAANRDILTKSIQQAIRTFAASATSMGRAAVKGFVDEVPQEILDEAFSQFAQGQAEGRAPNEVVSEFLTGLPELIGAAGLMGAGGEVIAARRSGGTATAPDIAAPSPAPSVENEDGPEWISQRGMERAAESRLVALREKKAGDPGEIGGQDIPGFPGMKTEARVAKRGWLNIFEQEELDALEKIMADPENVDHAALAKLYGKKIKSKKQVDAGGKNTPPPPANVASPITTQWTKPQPLDPKARRDLEQRADNMAGDDEQKKVSLARAKKAHQELRREIEDASPGERRVLEEELLEVENRLRRLAGDEELQLSPPVTPEDQAKADAYFSKRKAEIEAKLARGEPITTQDRMDWLGDESALPPKEQDIKPRTQSAPESELTNSDMSSGAAGGVPVFQQVSDGAFEGVFKTPAKRSQWLAANRDRISNTTEVDSDGVFYLRFRGKPAASRPEKWAAVEAALANFEQTTTMPPEVADKTAQKARVLIKIAQGAKPDSLDNDDLHLVGLHRDEAGKITQGHMSKNGWKKGPNPNGSPQPVEVLNGEFIITQRQIERLRNKEVGLGALADAIALPADERRAQILAKSEQVPSSKSQVPSSQADETPARPTPERGTTPQPPPDAGGAGAEAVAPPPQAQAQPGNAAAVSDPAQVLKPHQMSPQAFKAQRKKEEGPNHSPAVTEFEHKGRIQQAIKEGKPVSKAAVEYYGIKIPSGFPVLLIDDLSASALADDEIPMSWDQSEGSLDMVPETQQATVHPILAQAGFDEPALERAGLIATQLQESGLSADEAAVAAGSVVKRMGVVGADYTAQMVEDGFAEAMKATGFQRRPRTPTMWERKPSAERPATMTKVEKVPSSTSQVSGAETPANTQPLIERADFKQAADAAMMAAFERLRGAPDKKKAQAEVRLLTQARNALVDLVDKQYGRFFDAVVITPHGNGGGIQARATAFDPKTGRATAVALEIDPATFLEAGSRTREGIERVLNEEFSHRIDLMVSSEREAIDLAKAVHKARPGVFQAAWRQYFSVEIARGELPDKPPADLSDRQAFQLYFEATRLIHQGTFTTENAEMPDIPLMRRLYLYLSRWVQTVRREMRKLPDDLRSEWQWRIDQAENMMRKLQKAATAAEKAALDDVEPPESAVRKPKKAPAPNDPDVDAELEAAWEAEQKARRKGPTFTPAQQALRGLRKLSDPDNDEVNIVSRIAMEGGIAIYSDKVRKLRKQQGKPVGGELDWLERADIPPFWKGIIFRRGNQQNVDTIVGQLYEEGYFPDAAEQGDVSGEMLAAKIQDVLARYAAQKQGLTDTADLDEQYGAEMGTLERQRVEFERATESGPVKVRPADLQPGDVMQLKGRDGQLHPVEVVSMETRPLEAGEDYDPDGNPGHRMGPDGPVVIESVTLKDGTTFGVQTVDGQEGLFVDEFNVKDGADFDERLREAILSRKLDDADALLHFMDHYGMSPEMPLGEIVRQVQTRLKLPMKKAQQMLAAVFDTTPAAEFGPGVDTDNPLGAAAKRSLLEKPQYHSTPNETAAQSILQSGQVMPPALPHSRGKLTPVVGRVYMAPSTETAAIYSLGGVMMGQVDQPGWAPWWDREGRDGKPRGRYGYVFQIDPDSVQDIQPDEDNVGELAFKAMDGELPNAPYWLKSMGERLATPREKRDKWAYANYASLGKRMLKQMSDEQKLEMIERFNTNIAHAGPVRVLKAWKVDKARAGELARDGSNLLDVAEPVELPSPALASGSKRATGPSLFGEDFDMFAGDKVNRGLLEQAAGTPAAAAEIKLPATADFTLDTVTPKQLDAEMEKAARKAKITAKQAAPLQGTAGEYGTPDMLDITAGPMALFSQPAAQKGTLFAAPKRALVHAEQDAASELPPARPDLDDFLPPKAERKASGKVTTGVKQWHEALKQWKVQFAQWASQQGRLGAFLAQPVKSAFGPMYQRANVVTPRNGGQGWRVTVFGRYEPDGVTPMSGDWADGAWVPIGHHEFESQGEAYEDAISGMAGAEFTRRALFAAAKRVQETGSLFGEDQMMFLGDRNTLGLGEVKSSKSQVSSSGQPETLNLKPETQAFTLESPTGSQLDAEARRKKLREELQARKDRPLIGTQGDIGQMDMLGGNDLLSMPPAKAAAPAPEPRIGDFGEKIGGARKDYAVKGEKSSKPAVAESQDPGWRKRYTTAEIVSGPEKGRWSILDTRKKDWTGSASHATRTTFATEEEAEKHIPLVAVARQHAVYSVSTSNKAPSGEALLKSIEANMKAINDLKEANRALLMGVDLTARYKASLAKGELTPERYAERVSDGTVLNDADLERGQAIAAQIRALQETPTPEMQAKEAATRYGIFRNVTDRKRVQVVKDTFATREDALKYMLEHAEEIIETKTSFGEEILAKPENAMRKGPERRTRDADAAMFQEAFGFRGVEFGNWMRDGGTESERQEVLNHAFDGLHDLAALLDIPPKAISLNGDLALAFGARGHGLTGAKAHYERDYAVINLTKMAGAGSLAHEWFHALDHYLGRQDGKAFATRKPNKEGHMAYESRGREGDYVSHGFSYQSATREELRARYKELMARMFTKAEQFIEDTQKAEKFVGDARGHVVDYLAALRKDLAAQKDPQYYKRNNKPATKEQLEAFDTLSAKIIEGEDLASEYRYNKSGDTPANARGAMTGRWSNDTLDALSAIFKAVRGRAGMNADGNGPLDTLQQYMKRYKQRLDMLASATAQESKTKMVPTEYAMDAKRIDQGRASDYWTTEHEMAARAFSAYVEDKVKAAGGSSQFLSYGSDNRFYRLLDMRPFPEGKERETINKLFDEFFGEVKVKETEQGMMLYSAAKRGRTSTVKEERFKLDNGAIQAYFDLPDVQVPASKQPAAKAAIQAVEQASPAPAYSVSAAAGETARRQNLERQREQAARTLRGLKEGDADVVREALQTQGRFSTVLQDFVNRDMPRFDIRGAIIQNAQDFAAFNLVARTPYFESLKIAILDSADQVIHSQIVHVGALSESTAHPASMAGIIETAKRMYPKARLSGWMIAHNHPSGDPLPSDADKRITRKLEDTAAVLGLPLIDHVITNGEKYFSFRESGMISSSVPDTLRAELPKRQTKPKLPILPTPAAPAPGNLADWEAVPSGSLGDFSKPHLVLPYIATLRTADPDHLHVLYLDTRLSLRAVERFPVDMDTAKLTQSITLSTVREGAAGYLLTFPTPAGADNVVRDDEAPSPTDAQVRLVRRLRESAQSASIQFFDAMKTAPTGRYFSFSEYGLMEEPAKYGALGSAAKRSPVDAAAHEAATSPRNDLPDPTPAQREAGNYAKGHVRIAGHEISIENPAGSKRRPEWPALKDHYGYFKGTNAKDGDAVDVFVKPGTPEDYAGDVHVVRQIKVPADWKTNPSFKSQVSSSKTGASGKLETSNLKPETRPKGEFDEYKVMLGYPTAEEAKAAYLRNYEPGWPGMQRMTTHTAAEFARIKDSVFTVPADRVPGVRQSDAALQASARPPVTHTFPDGYQLTGPGLHTLGSARKRAYHGTPHKVDKFSTSKIGTGEGAQAYGWGLYFAESEGVAANYQKELGGVQFEGKTVNPRGDYIAFRLATNLAPVLKRGKTGEEARKIVREMLAHQATTYQQSQPTLAENAQKQLDLLDSIKTIGQGGNLYTVELLPDEDEWLDWDKPMSQQSAKVKTRLQALWPEADLDAVGSGADMYRGMSGSKIDASNRLAKAGIPGIRYLDGNSRFNPKSLEEARARVKIARRDAENAPQNAIYAKILQDEEGRLATLEQEQQVNTSNYVIFDENLVRILEENGQPVSDQVLASGAKRAPAVMPGMERLAPADRAKVAPAIWEMYVRAYTSLGMQYTDAADLNASGEVWEVARNAAGQPEAFFAWKPTEENGYKLAFTGQDGTPEGKATWKARMVQYMRTPGYYGELSDAPEHIVRKAGEAAIPVAQALVILGKPAVAQADGEHYERFITGLPTAHIKAMFGKPWTLLQSTRQPSEKSTGSSNPSSAPTSPPPRGKTFGTPSTASPSTLSTDTGSRNNPLASAAKRGPVEKVASAVFSKAPVAVASGLAKAGSAVVEKAGLQQVLAKMGSNNLDKFISNVVFGKVAKWAGVDTAKKAVEVWLGQPGLLSRLAKGTLDQTVPLWNVPREWLAAYHESQRKAAWGREKAMDVVRALSHNAKVSDLAYPQEFVEDPAWRVKLFDAMEGKTDMTTLPQPLQDLAERLRKLLKETGQELVRQGIMSLDTFEELSATGWMPRYTEEEAEAAGGSWLKAFKLGVKDLVAQRSTAWHIVDTTRKEKDGQYAIVSRDEGGKRNRWRFRNEQHRNAFYEDFIKREAVDMLTKGGKPVTDLLAALDNDATRAVREEIKNLTREKIDRPAELSQNLRNVVRRAVELQRFRYKKEAPFEPDKLIKDPVYSIARYVMGATHNAATMELLKQTAKNAEWVSDTALAGFTQIPDNDRFGPLSGKYVRDEIATQVLDLVQVPGTILGAYDAILRTWKAGKLVLNPGSHIRDAVGNVVFSVLSGSNPFNPGNLPFYRDAITALRDGGDTYAELIEMQVLGGDALTNEVKTALKGLLPDTKTLEGKPAGWVMRQIMGMGSAARGSYEFLAAVRQVPDNLYKTAAYLKYKAAGMSPAEAAAEVRKWFPYYDRLGTSALIKQGSRFVMPFSSFFRESTRILGRGAVERPLAMASILSFASGITALSLMMLGLGDEDEESVFRSMRGKLKLGLSGDRPVFAMLLPARTDEGQLQQWDLSSVLPFADLLGTRVEMRQGEDEWTKFWRGLFTQSPILSTAWAWSTNTDAFSGRKIVEEDMGAMESTKERLREFGDTMLPPLTPWFGVHSNTIANAGRRMSSLDTRNATQSYLRAIVGLDVRSADPNLRTETEFFRKQKGLPLANDGSLYATPLRSRLGRQIKGELIQDAPDIDTVADAMVRLEESGNPIRSRDDMEKLLKGLDPDRLIKEEYRRKLVQSFSPEALRVWRSQQREFSAAQKRLPAVMKDASPLVRARRARVSAPVTP
jgi:hypothetical protein